MSYKIKFDDITSVQVESQKTMNAWEEAIASLNKAMSDFINNQNLQGQAVSSMRNYLVEVHGTLLQTLVNLMNDYSTNLLLYKDGYYQIDSSNHAKLPGQVFTTLHSDLKSSRDNLKSEIELLNTTKDKVSDLVSYSGSSHTSTVMNYNFLMNQVKNLDNSIIQYESNHASQDLVAFKELLSATKALIAEHAGKTRTVGTYQSGDFAKLQSVQRFAMAYQQATKQMESRVERVQAAQERDKARFEALAAEDRAKNGWKDLAIGVVTVAFSILAIVGSMGFATPLVVGAGLTAGLGSFAYGASNAAEGIHNIQLGNAGDAHTKSYNLIRDTLFMGNDKLYHDVGNVFVTASAIMIPIGQTQSVVKGLTQFAIGEAGAYTAGQVAYHGTKLLGGSEEDAQTANFIGNIVGGYAVSSAASKFSLNKVKVDVEAPKYNREQILKNLKESKLARESSNFDQYLAKEKLQQGLNKSPLVSRELPKLKGVHDVEAPKYNREQILKNLEESKLARESSNFDQYLAKEKLQRGLNKSPLVSRELPKVKGVHDVETPKYNKEQILKNIEESKLARESSGFKDFATRERYLEKVFNKLTPEERELIFNISKNAPKVEYQPDYSFDSVLSMSKNNRPNVEYVYTPEYIKAHKQQFENGAIKFQKFTPEEGGYNNGAVGNEKDHVAFVMPREAGETLIKVTKGDPELLEDILGLHRGDLGSSPVAIEIPPESIKNPRIPSGNEESAFDDFWKPGGQTFPGNMPEAVIDEVPWGEFTIRKLGGD